MQLAARRTSARPCLWLQHVKEAARPGPWASVGPSPLEVTARKMLGPALLGTSCTKITRRLGSFTAPAPPPATYFTGPPHTRAL